jgi:hypothetical protein
MTTTNHWFIESNDYDDVLVNVNIDTPFEDWGCFITTNNWNYSQLKINCLKTLVINNKLERKLYVSCISFSIQTVDRKRSC